YSCLNGS
ncbi:hypothetical protein BVZ79_00561B, partial [Haemophilus influenzae]